MPNFIQSFYSAVSSSALTTITATLSSAINAGDLIAFGIAWVGDTTTVSVSDQAQNSWVVLPTIENGVIQGSAMVYSLRSKAYAAGNVITVTLGAGRTYAKIQGGEWGTGLGSYDSTGSAVGTKPATPTATLNTNSNNELVIGFGRWDSGSQWSAATTGWTARNTLPAGTILADSTDSVAGPFSFGPTVGTGGSNGNPWSLQEASFSPLLKNSFSASATSGAAFTPTGLEESPFSASATSGANFNGTLIQTPNVQIVLNVTKGISAINYQGTNLVDSTSALPLLRIQKAGDTQKNYIALSGWTVSTTNSPNDTLSATSPSANLTVVAKPLVDGFNFKVTIAFSSSLGAVLDYDLDLYRHRFHVMPTYDGTVQFTNGDNGFDCNDAMYFICNDSGASSNPWQIWHATLVPTSFHFAPKNYPNPTWDVYFVPISKVSGVPDPILLPAVGGSLTFDVQANYSASKPDPLVAAPESISIQSARWPLVVRQDLFPSRSFVGLNVFCKSGGNPVSNPNGWNNGASYNLYDPAGSGRLVAEMTGDVSGLQTLASWMIGRIQWCNYITYVKCGGISVIHWDMWDGEEYPQSGTSYVGDPRISRTQCRELWYRDANFPVPIISQCLDSLKRAYNPANPSDPTYCPNLMPGIALRASNWPTVNGQPMPLYTNPPLTQYSLQSQADAIANLSGKIDRVYWAGYRVFYIDSYGNSFNPLSYAVGPLRTVLASYPDCLFAPEAYNRADMYSCSAPFRDRFPSRSADPTASLMWPNSYCLMRMENYTGGNMYRSAFTITTAVNSFTVTVPSGSGILAGMTIDGNSNIPAGATVASISGTTVTMSVAATGAGTVSTWFTSQYYSAAVDILKRAYNKNNYTGPGTAGDMILANCYSGSPTELEQAYAIYQRIASGAI